jgi:hypothetical protein
MSVNKYGEILYQLTPHFYSVTDENLTYALTTNSLYPSAYSNANLPWFSFFPFGNWQNFYNVTYPNISPVQEALIETLTLAASYAPKTGEVFIDVANYGKPSMFLYISSLTPTCFNY